MAFKEPFAALLVALATCVLPVSSRAVCTEGATISPDGRTYMVNKNVGATERWTIMLSLAPGDPPLLQNATGVVLDTLTGASSFINCTAPDPERAGLSLTRGELSEQIALQCSGSGPCDATAVACAELGGTWTFIQSVSVPASFFLPRPCAEPAPASSLRQGISPPVSATADRSPVTFTDDKTTLLVNKNVNGERWAIALGLEPTGRGTERAPRRLSGNVYRVDPPEPAFVYCEPVQEIDLTKPLTTCSLRCQSTGPCEGDAPTCRSAWSEPIALEGLQVGFFLPAAGFSNLGTGGYGYDLGCPLPPCVARPERGERSSISIAGDTCTAEQCFVSAGSCGTLAGIRRTVEGLGCACVASLGDCRPECGAEECGKECAFDLGGGEFATGACKPTQSQSRTCSCVPSDADGITGCGGAGDAPCADSDTCCADDPTAACSKNNGANCPGTCVTGNGGLCTEREIRERTVARTCGNGIRDAGETCDSDDLGGQTCRRQGFKVGRLRCAQDCTRFDLSDCSNVSCSATLRFEPPQGFAGTPATAVLTVSPAEYVGSVTSACLTRNNVRTKLFPQGDGIFTTERFICGNAPATQTMTFSAWDAEGEFLCGGTAEITSLGRNPQVVDPSPCSTTIPNDPCDF